MDSYDASEQAYKNGYSSGYEAGRRSVVGGDVVSVVRCKDCKHSSGTRIEPKTCVCFRHGIIMFADHFCSWGERKITDG